MSEAAVFTPVALGLGLGGLLDSLLTLGMFLWARHVARKHGTLVWRVLVWLPVAAAVFTVAGLGGTIYGLVTAFDAVAVAAPEAKARLLADGISVAMVSTLAGLVAGAAALTGSLAASIVGTLRRAPNEGSG